MVPGQGQALALLQAWSAEARLLLQRLLVWAQVQGWASLVLDLLLQGWGKVGLQQGQLLLLVWAVPQNFQLLGLVVEVML